MPLSAHIVPTYPGIAVLDRKTGSALVSQALLNRRTVAPTPEATSPNCGEHEGLSHSELSNIPGADFVSITVHGGDHLRTVSATDPLAEQMDALQYQLREGPCYAAVTVDRFVLVNDIASNSNFPRYGTRAGEFGVRSQAAIQLLHDRETAGLNLYARKVDAFDRSTVHLAGLFAAQAAALLEYAEQVEQLSEALRTRTDFGTAVGIVMERYDIHPKQAFAFLVRNSNDRNVKLRVLANHVIHGTFESTTCEDGRSKDWS